MMSEQFVSVLTLTQFDGTNDSEIIGFFSGAYSPPASLGASRDGDVLTLLWSGSGPADPTTVTVGDWVSPYGQVFSEADIAANYVSLTALANPS
jgi:hypothetical protein